VAVVSVQFRQGNVILYGGKEWNELNSHLTAGICENNRRSGVKAVWCWHGFVYVGTGPVVGNFILFYFFLRNNHLSSVFVFYILG
jgi:hypothetical protein